MKYAALFLLLCLFGCAAPEIQPGKVRVLDFDCADGGINSLHLLVDGPFLGNVSWDNKDACGVPI